MISNKTYRIINWVAFGLLLYIFMLPFLSPVMRYLFPSVWVCPYNQLVHKPCPFCGITRDFRLFFSGKDSSFNPISLKIAFFLVLNYIARIVLLIIPNNKIVFFNLIKKIDLVLHILFFLILILWIVTFISIN